MKCRCFVLQNKENLNSSVNTIPLFLLRVFLDMIYVFVCWYLMQLEDAKKSTHVDKKKSTLHVNKWFKKAHNTTWHKKNAV